MKRDGRSAVKENKKRQKRLRKLFEAVCSGQRSRVIYRLFRGGVDVCGSAIEAWPHKQSGDESDGLAWDSATVCNGTPLHIACAMGKFDVAKVLVEHGADVNMRDARGTGPLHVACHRATTLLEAVRTEARHAEPPSTQVMNTAVSGIKSSVHAAAAKDVNCNADDGAERAPLAAEKLKLAAQATALCAFLVSRGADAHVPDRWGATAVDIGLNTVLDAYVRQQAEDDALKRARLASTLAAADAEAWIEKILHEHELETRTSCDGVGAAFGFGDGWEDIERSSAAVGVRGARHAKVRSQLPSQKLDAESTSSRGIKRGCHMASPASWDGYSDHQSRSQRPRMAWEHDIPHGGSGNKKGQKKQHPQTRASAQSHTPQPVVPQHMHSVRERCDRLQLDETAWQNFCTTAARMKEANTTRAAAASRSPATSAGLSCADIPWPSGPQDNLLNFDLTAPPDKLKRLVRAAWLRWHPDKFVQKFGDILMSGVEHKKIMQRLKEVAQHINDIAVADRSKLTRTRMHTDPAAASAS